MLSWVIQITIISIILIFLVHHLIHFFKNTLTVPKIKDLVNTPTKNYENMYNIIQNNLKKNNSQSEKSNNQYEEKDYSMIDLLPVQTNDNSNMKNELKNFLKKQLQTNGSESLNSYTSY
jgi:hypothetical protein